MSRLLVVLTVGGRTFDIELRTRRDIPAPAAPALQANGSAVTEIAEHVPAVDGFNDPFGFTPAATATHPPRREHP